MLKKYLPVLNNIYEYIRNRIVANAPVESVAIEVAERFSPEILFPNASNEDLADIILMLVKYAYFMHSNEPYDKP